MSRRASLIALPLCVGLLGPLGAAAGCGLDGATTGKRVALSTRVEPDPELAQGFTTGKGWLVRLSLAQISTGAFYYFDGEPAVVSGPLPGPSRGRLARALGLGVARAHPGHYAPGEALGEALSGAAIDLISGPAVLPRGSGLSGTYRSATFSFAKGSAGPASGSLGESVALVEGQAQKGSKTVFFRLSASLEDVSQSLTEGHVPGCTFEPADVEADGAVTVHVRASPWFNLVDFDAIAPGSADQPTEVARGEGAQIAFSVGLAQLTAYRFSYSP